MLVLFNSLILGFLTSITPCVLTADVAVLSYTTKKSNNSEYILFSSLLYMFGRAFVYTIISIILSISIDNIDLVSSFLQNKLNLILGFILIIVGLALLNLINLEFLHFSFVNKIKEKSDSSKYLGSFILGILFAGMFCPVTASLFISNFLQNQKSFLSFIIYGLMTGLPTLILGLIVIATKNIGKIYKFIEIFEKYSSKITGAIFLLMGIFLIFKLF